MSGDERGRRRRRRWLWRGSIGIWGPGGPLEDAFVVAAVLVAGLAEVAVAPLGPPGVDFEFEFDFVSVVVCWWGAAHFLRSLASRRPRWIAVGESYCWAARIGPP